MLHHACLHVHMHMNICTCLFDIQVCFFYTWQIIIFNNIKFNTKHYCLFPSYCCAVVSLLITSGYGSLHWLYLVSRMLSSYYTPIWCFKSNLVCFKSTELGNTNDSEEAGKFDSHGFISNVWGINVLCVRWVPILFASFQNIMVSNQSRVC